MKKRSFRLLSAVLSMMMMLTLGISAYAATSKTVTKAGSAAIIPENISTDVPTKDETPSESAYYVVWDDFTYVTVNESRGHNDENMSSWDITLPQGAVEKTDGATFEDKSIYAKAQALRAFNAVSDDFTMEFTMRMSAGMEDTFVDIKDGDTTAIRFAVADGKLLLGTEELCAVPVAMKHFKLNISPANGTYTVSVDGGTVMNGNVPKEFTFQNSTDAIDRFYFETGVEETGTVCIGTLRVYVDYYVNEKFLDGTNLAINDEWTVTGDATTIYKEGTQGPDNYNALLKSGASISRDVTIQQDGAWVEFQQLMEVNDGEFVMTLADEAGNELKVATKDGKFGYYNGTEFVGLYDCLSNMWYHVKLEQTEDGTEIYLNHKLKTDKLPNVKFTKMTFTMTGGEAMVDDILVKDWIPLPEDYVPEPIAVEKENNAKLVGLQSCNIWVEGEHFGYDWLTDWEERTPVLGYYDEISKESADWELKFKIEHGIDFELYCWYRTTNGQGAPIKMARNSRALHDGYMNAEYSDQMKFAITWEAGGGGKDLKDFKENIVPYWIEQYFKDDRYMVIDNKPLVGMYNINQLKTYFGGNIAGVKEALDYLRQACKEAGFDDAYIIMSNSAASSAQEIAQAGFDGQYAYTWGNTSNVVSTQTKGMESIQNVLVNAGQGENGVVPTVSQGFWDKAWNRNDGNYASVETFQEVLRWVKEDFMPTLDQSSIGSKVVLLDNWNEYGEGHFIMPAELAGFGYLDAVKTVFGDGAACAETVQHVEPTQAQLERINHMYIQDRHVVKVDKGSAASNMVPMEGYNWTFGIDNDTEGWEIGASDGKWIKDLKEWAVKDGYFWGLTFTPDELAEKVASGELQTGATCDPSIMSPTLELDADQAIAIKVRMRGEDGVEAIGKPRIYFTTETDPAWTGSKVVDAGYTEGDDGYAEVIFNMTSNSMWTGTVCQLRFDPIQRDGEFWIDSIQILEVRDSGDAEIYLNGNKVYNTEPVVTVGGQYMFPVEEINTLIDAEVNESLEKDRLYIATENAFFEFPYEEDVKMLVNGVTVDSIGVATVEGGLYIPIADFFENMGTVTEVTGAINPLYTVTLTPATTDAKAKIEIDQYMTTPRVVIEESPYTIYEWDFAKNIASWAGGGTTGLEYNADLESIKVTCTEQSATTGTTYRMNVWSSTTTGGVIDYPVNLTGADATHVLVRVITDVEPTEMTLAVNFLDDAGKGTGDVYYDVPYQKDENGDYYALVDLSSNESFDATKKIARVGIWPLGDELTAEDEGKMVNITSIEILDRNWDITVDSEYFTAENSWKAWVQGGTTVLSNEDQCLVATPPTAANDYNPRFWSKMTTATAVTDPYEYTTDDVTHVRVRLKVVVPTTNTLTAEEKAELANITTEDLKLNIQYTDKSGLKSKTHPYAIGTDGFEIVTFDISDMIDEGKTVGRIGLEPFDGGNELLCKAGAYVMVDSIQFMKRPDDEAAAKKVLIIGNSITKHAPAHSLGWAGDWGMAATSADKDYVHLLEDSILAKNSAVEVEAINISQYEKYYYDWTQISDTKDGYASWDADIIIATFGANVNNGANEGDSSYENNYTFTTEYYKKIIDKFNPDGDATVIAGATVLTNEQIVKVIKDAATAYGYTYVDMTEWTGEEYKASNYADEILAYYRQVTGDTTNVTAVNAGVLNHPGDKGMEKIAEELWTALEPMIPQGTPAVDDEEPDTPVVPDEPDTPVTPEEPEETETPAFEWTFDTSIQGWGANAAGLTTFGNEEPYYAKLSKHANATAAAQYWTPSPTNANNAGLYPDIDVTTLDKIVLRAKSLTGAPQTLAIGVYEFPNNTSTERAVITGLEMGTDWTVITIDADDIEWNEGTGNLQRFYIKPSNDNDATGLLMAVDYMKIYTKEVDDTPVTPEEPDVPVIPEEPVTPAFEWTFDTSIQGWGANGAGLVSFGSEEPCYAKLSRQADATAAAQFWTPKPTDVSNAGLYPDINVTILDKIELRAKSLTDTAQTLTIGVYEFPNNTSTERAVITGLEMGTDWTVITIDADDIEWDEGTGNLQRFYIKPSNDNDTTGLLMAVDYMKIYTKTSASE